MTVVNPKSISGINSITTGSGSDNLLTIHTSDASSTERVRINSSGDVIVGSGITVSPDGDIFATGVTTATTFVGALTGNVTGNATGLSGTPNISAGTIAGSTGTFTGDVDIADKIVHTGDTDTAIRFSGADTITAETAGSERVRISSAGKMGVGTNNPTSQVDIHCGSDNTGLQITSTDAGAFASYFDNTGASTIGHSGTGLVLSCDPAGSVGSSNIVFQVDSNSEKARIDSSGNFLVGGTSLGAADSFGVQPSGHFRHISASGSTGDTLIGAVDGVSNGFQVNISGTNVQKYKFHNGSTQTVQIDSDGLKFMNDTAAANALDDYEEGTFTFTKRGFAGGFDSNYALGNQTGKYTKIGRVVTLKGGFNLTGNSGNIAASDYFTVYMSSLPFAMDDTSSGYSGAIISHQGEWWAYTSLGGGSNAKGSIVAVYNDYLSFYCTSVTGSPVRNSNEITFTITYTSS